MKKQLKNIKFYLLILLGVISLLSTAWIIYKNVNLLALTKEKPQDIVIANVSTKSVQIYWKSSDLEIPKVTYKKISDTGLYQNVDNIQIYQDITTGKNIYSASLDNLDTNTEYTYKIETSKTTWDNNYKFSTLDFAQQISIPNIVTGNTQIETLVLVTANNLKYMVDTQYHGTWALDISDPNYTVTNYANYKTSTDLGTELLTLLGFPVYAASGANCKTGIVINSSPYLPTKAKVVDVLGRWTEKCPGGTYASECYADVYCKALAAGVKPAFAMAIWSNESGGSNYANLGSVEDFGIHTAGNVSKANFDQQSTYFLNNIAKAGDSYISGCDLTDKMAAWGAKFYQGSCTDPAILAKGKTYIDQISRIYSWYTNVALSWPFTVTPQSGVCSYSSATVNTVYHACDGTTSTGTPASGDQTPVDPTLQRTVLKVTGEDRYCKDDYGCTCKYVAEGKSFDVSAGYTCPAVYTGQAVKTVKICCRNTKGLSVVMPYKCDGEIRDNISATACVAQDTTMTIKQGVNFIQAFDVVNTDELSISTAKGLIEYSQNKIIAVGLFRNDHWDKLLKVENGVINGTDFNLTPGESYLVISTEPVSITAKVYPTDIPMDLGKLTGWNLIPTSVFGSNSITTKSILQNTTYNYISQIAVWSESTGNFDYNIEETTGSIYGNSITVPQNSGLFIRVTK